MKRRKDRPQAQSELLLRILIPTFDDLLEFEESMTLIQIQAMNQSKFHERK